MVLTLHTTADCTMTVLVVLVDQVQGFLTAIEIALGHRIFICTNAGEITYNTVQAQPTTIISGKRYHSIHLPLTANRQE